jgi:hypothetical protein
VSTKNLASLLHQMLSAPEFKRQSLKETSPASKIGNTKSRFFVVVLLEAVKLDICVCVCVCVCAIAKTFLRAVLQTAADFESIFVSFLP